MSLRHFLYRVLALVAFFAATLAVFLMVVRPWYLNWGATAEERKRPLLGDEIIPGAGAQQTRAITINAPVRDVWPWLAQVGQDRGGFFSFDLLENFVGCEMPTVDVLRPEKQVWHLGDKLWMYPPTKAGGVGYAVLRSLIPGRALGFATHMVGTSPDSPEDGSWTFVLEPMDSATTRLLIRGRGPRGYTLLGTAFYRGIFEPLHFTMERRMMIGVKELAETGSRSRVLNHVHILLWIVTGTLGLIAAYRVLRRPRWMRSLASLTVAGVVFQILTLRQPPLLAGLLLTFLTALAVRDRPAAPSARLQSSVAGARAEVLS